MDNKYIELFQLIEDILIKQEAQKMRGLNDYNMVNVVRKASHEVGMHSNVIYSLINPNGLHYQNDLFLNLFIEKVLNIRLKDFGKVLEVNVEEQTNKNRRIDFTIKSENYLIGIEMKVNARDLKNQIFDYFESLQKELNEQKICMYYLTKDGKDASQASTKGIDIERISFQEHILDWLNACQNEVKNITNLNVALEDYKNIVKKVTNKYKGNVVSIEEELLKSNKHLKNALLLDKKMNHIKGKVLNRFFEDIEISLGKEFTSVTKEVRNVDKDRVFDEKKCINLYSKTKYKPKHFGVFFDCKFFNNLYLSIELHVGHLYYGLVKLKNFKLIPLTDNDRELFKGISSEKNTRYVKKITNTLSDENILDFGNSKLKDEIVQFIHQVKENQK